MTKAEFIDQVVRSSATRLSKKDTEALVDVVFAEMGKAIAQGKRFAYPGFGTFTLRERAARKGRNPRTGEAMRIKASRTVGFKPAPTFRQSL